MKASTIYTKIHENMGEITPITITTDFSKGFLIISGMLLIIYFIFRIDEIALFSLIFAIFSCLCCGMSRSIKENQKNKVFPSEIV